MSETSIILFCTKENHDNKAFQKALQSIADLKFDDIEILIINTTDRQLKDFPNGAKVLNVDEGNTLGKQLNQAFERVSHKNILFMDNRVNGIVLKRGAVELFNLAIGRSKNPGLVYADYAITQKSSSKEIHLLKHHLGRVRDNQDFGKVFFFTKSVLKKIGYADESLKFNTLYDLRLKISQNHELIHIANRYAGSLYSIESEGTSQNVFDYLLAGKESQLEAEAVLSSHLKAIGAYLDAGKHQRTWPDKGNSTLKASIIIPVNNRPDFIRTAIDSVQAQTVQEIEIIIVVNGGKDDPTIAAVKDYMAGGAKYNDKKPTVRLLNYEINNLGLCLNMGARAALGKYYVQLDSDDRLKTDAVEKILAVYNEDPKIGMVIGSYEVWEKHENGTLSRMESLPVVTHDEWTEENGRNNLLRIGGAGAPRSIPIELIRQIGFSVNEEPYCRNYGEDYGMVLKISEQHRIGRVWDAIYEVIRHSGGTDHSIDQSTVDRNDEAKDFMRKEAILRRIELNNK